MKKLILLFLILATSILFVSVSAENSETSNININGFDVDLSVFNITENITFRDLVESRVENFEQVNIDSKVIKFFLPKDALIISSDESKPFVIRLTKEGDLILFNESADKTDVEISIEFVNATIEVNYIKPNTFMGCVIASLAHKTNGFPLKEASGFKFKLANFIVGLFVK